MKYPCEVGIDLGGHFGSEWRYKAEFIRIVQCDRRKGHHGYHTAKLHGGSNGKIADAEISWTVRR